MDYRISRALEDLRRLLHGYVPTADDLAEAPLLDSWSLLGSNLLGRVSGHPTITDGHRCLTSVVLALAADHTWARTVIRFYRLGRPLWASFQ